MILRRTRAAQPAEMEPADALPGMPQTAQPAPYYFQPRGAWTCKDAGLDARLDPCGGPPLPAKATGDSK